jgi:hypothetical protein
MELLYKDLTGKIVDCAVKVHRQLGLGLLELGYRLDLLVEDKVVIEVKSVECLNPVHTAQLMTYLKLSGCKIGLLINFNVVFLKEGIRRIIV